MQVAGLLSGPVVALEIDDTLQDAAREMEANGLSAIAVCESGLLVGIVTERDLVRAVADEVALELTPIEEYMTAAPVTLRDSDHADGAFRIMLDGEFRHIPVLDDEDEVVGMLRMRDVVRALVHPPQRATAGARSKG